MKEFLKKMVSASSDVSHKRIIVIAFAICVIIFCFVATYTSKIIPEFMFDALCWMLEGGMGLTILDKFTQKKIEKTDGEEN